MAPARAHGDGRGPVRGSHEDGGVGPGGLGGGAELGELVGAPAGHRAVVEHRACVLAARGDRDHGVVGGVDARPVLP